MKPVMGRLPLAEAEALPSPPLVGERPSLALVYDQHFEHVWHTLRRCGIRTADLEDKAHDVFIIVHRKLAEFDPTRPIRPWLTGITFRVASDERRRARYRREVARPDMDRVSGGLNPEQQAVAAQRRALVQRGLDALPMNQRIVFVMHDIEGCTIPEIRAQLDVSPNTLYSRLRLAREKFEVAVRAVSQEVE